MVTISITQVLIDNADCRAVPRNLHLTDALVILVELAWYHTWLEETLAYSRKPNFSHVTHMARFSLSSLCCLSASLFSKHLGPSDPDLVTFPWRTHRLLSLLPHLAVYAVPSARNAFASLFSLINYPFILQGAVQIRHPHETFSNLHKLRAFSYDSSTFWIALISSTVLNQLFVVGDS